MGVDVGGTFTDVVLPAADGSLHALKLLSSPDDYGRAIVAGVKELLESAGVDAAAVDELVHGTTVATNAVLEGTGAPTGLLTTRGFRDVLEIRRIRIPVQYDFAWEKPRPLVARERRLEVDERINARGEVERTLDPQQVRRTVEQLLERGAEALAVCLLNSYANPVHEREIGALLDRHFPAIPHTLSTDVVPGDRRVRAHQHHRHQRLSAAVGAFLPRLAANQAGGHRRHGKTAGHAIARRNCR